jgi:DNA-binding transcriptional regulator GbsR (MarR family)
LIENYKTALVLSNEHIEELEKEQDENVKKLKEELINYHVDKGEWYKYYIRAKDVFEIIDSIFKDNHNQHTKPVDLQSDELSEAHKDISFRSEMDKTADAEPSDEHRALVTRDDAVSRIDDGSPNILEEFEINLNKIQEKYLGIMQKEMDELRREYCKNYSQQTNPTNSEGDDELPESEKSNGKQDKVKTADVIIINATPETMAQYYLEQDEKGEEEK